MTESEWNSTDDPESLIEWLFFERLSDRKVRLFACACCRSVAHFVSDEHALRLLTNAESFADGFVSDSELTQFQKLLIRQHRQRLTAGQTTYEAGEYAIEAIFQAADIPSPDAAFSYSPGWYESEDNFPYPRWAASSAADAAYSTESNWQAERAKQLLLLRDIFGNPFRPVAFDPRWRSESAVALARTADNTRNFALLPILADALEEAGCDHPDVLTHCRDPNGIHVRGCWVVDGVLGKV